MNSLFPYRVDPGETFDFEPWEAVEAENLHAVMCHDNHTDGCNWWWDNTAPAEGWRGAHTQVYSAHRNWILKARRIRDALAAENDLTMADVIAVLRLINNRNEQK